MPESTSHGSRSFRTTQWSLVGQIRSADPQVRADAQRRLIERYYPALHRHLSGWFAKYALSQHVDDVLQQFVIDKVLERDLLARADRERGRLRNLLLKSLENYARTYLTRARPGAMVIPLDPAEMDIAFTEAATSFHAIWARDLLQEAIERMREECQRRRRWDVWHVFEARILRPCLEGGVPVEYRELVRGLNLRSPGDASNLLVTAKRQFERLLRAAIEETVDDSAEVDDELRDLQRIVASGGELGVHIPSDSRASSTWEDLVDRAALPALAAALGASQAGVAWGPEDWAAVLEHQLALPAAELPGLPLIPPEGDPDTWSLPLVAHLTLGQGSLKTLRLIKDAAKGLRNTELAALPQPVSTAIYFAAIAAAIADHELSISSSPPDVIRLGVVRCAEQSWLPASLRDLLTKALGKL